MKNKLTLILILIMALTVLGGYSKVEAGTISFGEPDWTGIRAKNAVANQILEKIGYETETTIAADEALHHSLATDNLDVHLGSWMPSVEAILEEIENDIDIVATNMDEGIYTLGVPSYVWEAGVRSFADLADHAEKFDKTLYLGPVGWPFSEAMAEAIESDTYGLGDWEIKNSSTPAMLAQMERAVQNEEWIVTLAWRPHWMNYIMDIKYLEDPKEIWADPESWVNTLARTGLENDHPQVYKFLEQFKVDVEDNDMWIYEIGQEERDAEKVASEWIANNLSTVAEWLRGVKAANGEPAIEVLKNNLN